MRNIIQMLVLGMIFIAGSSCKKDGFLDARPNKSLVIPNTIKDCQAILDNVSIMNGFSQSGTIPVLGEVGSDDYYLVSSYFSDPFLTKLYTWNDQIYDEKLSSWSISYRTVFYANVVLETIAKVATNTSVQTEVDNVKGSALFYRSHMFYHLAQVYAPLYNKDRATSEWGIPLRVKADVGETIERANVSATYKRIIDDLKEASSLLPNGSEFKARPTKPAAFALLARTYLSMGLYDSAFVYSNKCLTLRNELIDYNELDSATFFPITNYVINNPEIIFPANLSVLISIEGLPIQQHAARITSDLYNSYHANDLRKGLFFGEGALYGDEGYFFRGSYAENDNLFGGLAVDEVYLIRAECAARLGNISEAMADLNKLMTKRWRKTAVYPAFSAVNKEDALAKVLLERRKELVFRGVRWTDLKRLNMEGANITVTRDVNGKKYSLAPNSPLYNYLIPPDVISFNPTMPQNKR